MLMGVDTTILAKTLLHSLWQGALVYGVVWATLSLLGERRVHARYWVAMAGVLVISILAIATYSWMDFSVTHTSQNVHTQIIDTVSSAESTAHGEEIVLSIVGPMPEHIPTYSNTDSVWPSWQVWVSMLWGVGVVLMLFRTLRALWATARFQGECTELNESALLESLGQLKKRMNIGKHIRLLVHETLSQPATMGFLRPAIILPASAITGLNEEQLRAVLAHELAHIRRFDYVFNIIQLFSEALFFFNPFVWLLSRAVRFEREICCDQLAAECLNSTRDYAQALLKAVEIFHTDSALVLNSLGADKSMTFVERFRRLVSPGTHLRFRWNTLLGICTGALFGIISLTFLTYNTVIFGGDLLSPEERIEMIESVNDEGNGLFTIRGKVISETGEPITEDIILRPSGSYVSLPGGEHANHIFKGESDQSFEAEIKNNTNLHVITEGFPIATFGPYTGEPGSTVEDVVITLSKERMRNRVRIVNQQGQPLVGVNVKGRYSLPESNRVSDAQGELEIHGTPWFPLELTVYHPGYQHTKKIFELAEGKTHTWTLETAHPVQGLIRSEETGQPIPGAIIEWLKIKTPGRTYSRGGIHNGESNGAKMGESDDKGLFTLGMLQDGAHYDLIILAEGFAPKIVRNIQDDSKPLNVKMEYTLTISGQVHADGAEMPKHLTFTKKHDPTTGYHDVQQYYEVDIVDGKFQTNKIPKGTWQLSYGGKIKPEIVTLDGPVDDLEFTIQPPKPTIPTRIQRISFVPPKSHPLPNGEAYVAIQREIIDENGTTKLRTWSNYNAPERRYNVQDGKLDIEIPVDSKTIKINVREDSCNGLLGYVFEGIELEETFPGVIEIPCEPAGIAQVRVLDRNGELVKKPILFGVGSRRFENNGLTTFLNIPYGEKHQYITRINGTTILGPQFKVTARNPVAEITIQVPNKSYKLEGVAVDEQGKPVPDMIFQMLFTKKGEHVDASTHTTDSEGRFVIDPIYKNAALDYEIKIGHDPYKGSKEQRYLETTIPIINFSKPIRITLKWLEMIPEARVKAVSEAMEEEHSGELTIRGKVVTEDGEAIEGRINLLGYGESGSTLFGSNQITHEFKVTLDNSSTLMAFATGYVPAIFGPIQGFPNSQINDVVLTLKRGEPEIIKLVNEKGEPLAGVEVPVMMQTSPGSSTGWGEKRISDENGHIEVLGIPEVPMVMKTMVSGYQRSEQTFVVGKGNDHTWTFIKAKPVHGVVRSEATGKPIAGAKIRLAKIKNKDHTYTNGVGMLFEGDWSGPLLATSDESGKFTINTLEQGTFNTISASAAGHPIMAFENIQDTDGQIEILLEEPLFIKGRLEYDSVTMPESLILSQEEPDYMQIDYKIDVVEGTFHFPNISKGRWAIKIPFGGMELKEIELTESIDDLVIVDPNRNGREVTLNFAVPKNNPTAQGEVRVAFLSSHIDPTNHVTRGKWLDSKKIVVTDGKAEITVPANCNQLKVVPHDFNSKGLEGYFFEEQKINIGKRAKQVNIPCQNAGLIRVNVVGEDGETIRPEHTSVFQVPEKDEVGNTNNWEIHSRRNYIVLPLDRNYRVRVKVKGSFLLSEPFLLDATHSLHETTLVIPEKNKQLNATVVDEKGKPINGLRYYIDYSIYRSRFGSHGTDTNATGKITIDNVFYNLDFKYTLKLGHHDDKRYDVQYVPIENLSTPLKIVMKAKAQ